MGNFYVLIVANESASYTRLLSPQNPKSGMVLGRQLLHDLSVKICLMLRTLLYIDGPCIAKIKGFLIKQRIELELVMHFILFISAWFFVIPFVAFPAPSMYWFSFWVTALQFF